MRDHLNRRLRPAGRTASAEGARSRAWGCSSSAAVRSISAGRPSDCSFKARRLEAGEPARNATRAPSRLPAVSGTITTGFFVFARPRPRRRRPRRKSIGRAARASFRQQLANFAGQQRIAAHHGHHGRSLRASSANLMLRFARRGLEAPAQMHAADANHDAAGNITHRHAASSTGCEKWKIR